MAQPEITGRPADLHWQTRWQTLTEELEKLAAEKSFSLCDEPVDDVLTYALFAQTALKFLENRGNPDAFEPAPGSEPEPEAPARGGTASCKALHQLLASTMCA